jgi:carboxypeptidase family protein
VNRESSLGFALMVAMLAAFDSSECEAQATELRGRVVTDSGVPIPDATITLAGIGYSVRSDSLGVFRFTGTAGSTLTFRLRAPGFREDSASIVLPRGGVVVVVRDFVLMSEVAELPEPNPSDRVLRGRVTDTELAPLAYANLQVNFGRRYLTDDSGRFTIPVPSTKQFSIFVRRIGFEPEEVKFDSLPSANVRFQLRAVARVLPEQRVTGRAAYVSLDMGGFYRRMQDSERGINRGYFITPEDLDARKPPFLTQMAEGFPSIRLKRGLTPRTDVILGRLGCKMTVYLDRVRIVGKLSGRNDDLVNEMAPVTHVAAMEIYPSAVGAPPEYQPLNGTCGVVLIWTK